jgi:hypothetical protein
MKYISLLRNFEIYIREEMLPMILVRNYIVDMLGGEIGKTASRRIKNKFSASGNRNSSLCTIYWYIGRVWTWRLLLSLWQCLSRRGIRLSLAKDCDPIAPLIPVNKNIIWNFRHNQSDSCLCLIRGAVGKLAQAVFGDSIWYLGETVGASWEERLER